MKTINTRSSDYDIEDIFLKRYSPRAMSGVAITKEELMTLFEAARWAPSASNNQSWRFLYAIRETPDFELFLSYLNESNQIWCKNSGALVIILSKKTFDDGKPNPTHSFETGSAWENFALQGAVMNLVVHGMAGYNKEMLRESLGVPEDYEIELMVTVGYPGDKETLPEKLQSREAPSTRKELDQIVFEGKVGTSQL
jgi:nitroreductase